MKILVVNPYKAKLLRTIEALEKINIGSVQIIGDYNKMSPILFMEKIKIRSKVIDLKNDDNVVNEVKRVVDEETLVVIGELDEYHQKMIFDLDCSSDINYFYIIDLLELQHFVFVSNYSKKRYLDFEDKRKAISSVFDFMKILGVKKSNCVLITDKKAKSDTLEVNLIKMILKDEIAKNINIMTPCKINEVFDHNSDCNVFNKNVNLIVFKNYEITKTFIDTLSVFFTYLATNGSKSKIASVCSAKKTLFIDTAEQRSEQDILFSILLVSKYLSVKNNLKFKLQFSSI